MLLWAMTQLLWLADQHEAEITSRNAIIVN
jgi:hypothetical protein